MSKFNTKSEYASIHQEMKKFLEGEANAKKLSRSKVMYSRRGDEADTFIIRDLYPSAQFDRFGIKGIEKLKWTFYRILSMMNEKQSVLMENNKSDVGIDGLSKLLDSLDQEDRDEMMKTIDMCGNGSMTISWNSLSSFPQLKMLQYIDEKVANGIYLFASDALKAIRHMNAIFRFSTNPHLLPVETEPIKKCKTDDFF